MLVEETLAPVIVIVGRGRGRDRGRVGRGEALRARAVVAVEADLDEVLVRFGGVVVEAEELDVRVRRCGVRTFQEVAIVDEKVGVADCTYAHRRGLAETNAIRWG